MVEDGAGHTYELRSGTSVSRHPTQGVDSRGRCTSAEYRTHVKNLELSQGKVANAVLCVSEAQSKFMYCTKPRGPAWSCLGGGRQLSNPFVVVGMSRISDAYPGPGSYEISPSRSMTVLPSPRKGSPRRSSSPSPRRSSSPRVPRLDPSPRAFAERHVPSAKYSQGSFDSGSYSARGGFQFASEMGRESTMFDHVAHIGDPGAYVGYQVEGVHAGKDETMGCRTRRSFNTDAAHGDGKFLAKSPRQSGVSQHRASSAPRGSLRGGPGEYDYDHFFKMGSAREHSELKSMFKSQTPLGGHVRKSTTPTAVGVGKYDGPLIGPGTLLKTDHNFSNQGASMFAGSPMSKRTDYIRRTTDEIIGPGYYDLSGDVRLHNNRLAQTRCPHPHVVWSGVAFRRVTHAEA